LKPLISVIIPTFNRGSLLEETLRAVQHQTFRNWECIIVDDGSNDDTEQIVNAFKVSDQRFFYVKRPSHYTKGACACRNYGFVQSVGKYIQWLDDDDLLSRDKLLLQSQKLEDLNNPLIFTTCDWDLMWPGKILERKNVLCNKDYLLPGEYFKTLRVHQTFVPIHTFLISRLLILKAGLWNIQLTLNDDAEFISRVIIQSEKLINTKSCYVLYREHMGERISRKKDVSKLKSQIFSLKLIEQHLEQDNIISKSYFKWKLLLLFHQNWKLHKPILREENIFFLRYDIDLRFADYYILKHWIYQKIYPFYKRRIKSKI